MISDVFTDHLYKNQGRGGKCSGHDSEGKKIWLEGLQFQDGVTLANSLDNTVLIDVLNPTTDLFRDLQDSLYEDSRWDW